MCFSSSSVTIISRFFPWKIVALRFLRGRERNTKGTLPWKKKKNRVEKRTIRNRRRKKFSFFLFFLFGSREGRGDSRDRGALCYLGVALMRASVFFFLPLKRIFRPVWTGWNLPSPREIKRGHLPDRRKIIYVCPRRTITWTSPITRMPSLRNNNCIPSENTRYEPFLLSFFFSFFFHISLSLSLSSFDAITSSRIPQRISRDRNRWIIQSVKLAIRTLQNSWFFRFDVSLCWSGNDRVYRRSKHSIELKPYNRQKSCDLY